MSCEKTEFDKNEFEGGELNPSELSKNSNEVEMVSSVSSSIVINPLDFTQFIANMNFSSVSVIETFKVGYEEKSNLVEAYFSVLEVNDSETWYSLHTLQDEVMFIFKVTETSHGFDTDFYLSNGDLLISMRQTDHGNGTYSNEILYVNNAYKNFGFISTLSAWAGHTKDCLVEFWDSPNGYILGVAGFFGGPYVGGAIAAGSIIGCGINAASIM